jgi:hypothetical protein
VWQAANESAADQVLSLLPGLRTVEHDAGQNPSRSLTRNERDDDLIEIG